MRDVAMKRLRFIDDYCRVKQTSLSPSGSAEGVTQPTQPTLVFSHAFSRGLEVAVSPILRYLRRL